MLTPEFDKVVNEIIDHCPKLLLSKGHDYATEDRLNNFKRVTILAKTLGIDFSQSHHYALLMTVMKLDRLQNLTTKGKTPNHEGIKDTIEDAINYLILTSACIQEENESQTTSKIIQKVS